MKQMISKRKLTVVLILLLSVYMQAANTYSYDFTYDYEGVTYRLNLSKREAYADGLTANSGVTDVKLQSSFTLKGSKLKELLGHSTSDKVNVSGVTLDSNANYDFTLVSVAYGFKQSGVTSIVIPNTVKDVAEGAFSRCKSLKTVQLGNGLSSIGIGAFLYCTSLQSIVIPNTVTELLDDTFGGCTALTSVTLSNSLKAIGARVFEDCSSLGNITLPTSLEKIEERAFYMSGVTGVSIDSGSALKTIGNKAFYGCKQLNGINLPEGLTSIGEMAFLDCKQLLSISLPNSLESVSYQSFNGCSALESVNVGDMVKRIEDMAFLNCSGLKSVSFGDESELEYIGKWAFSYCSSLMTFLMPNSVASLGESPLSGCSKLETVRISGALGPLPSEFFSNFTSVKKVTWGASSTIRSIASRTFINCKSLETVEIPASVISIDEAAFASCSSLKSINLPVNLAYIGYNAFARSGLTEVTLPDNVKTLEGYVFYSCKDLKTFNMGNGLTEWDMSNINGCDAIESVQWSDGLTKIDKEAFSKKSKLKSFTFGPNPKLEEIGERAFAESGLTSFEMPNTVKTIGEKAFHLCWLLEDITLSEQLKEIPSFALAFTKIKELSIPASVAATGYNSFYGQELVSPYANTLTDVYIYATTPPVKCEDSYASDSRNISYSAKYATLHVPYGTKAAYAEAEGWKNFKAIVEMENEVMSGDLNGDGEVNGTDLVTQTNIILTNQYNPAADLNNDGIVNGTDYVMMVNKILNIQ